MLWLLFYLLMNEIAEKILREKDLKQIEYVSMLFDISRNDEDIKLAKRVLCLCRKNIREHTKKSIEDTLAFHKLYKSVLLYCAPHDFDSYLLYVEMNRQPKERFYVPRRKVLLPVVKEMQKLVDNELDELFLSMPPRVGKTTLVSFFVTWVLGRNPEKSNLYSAFSDTITQAFYNGILEIITDDNTYLWHDVFPDVNIVATNAAMETLDLKRKKRYPSLTSRSLYGTLNGACDCNGILVSDDLIGGIEEALNKNRLDGTWSKVDNNLLPRAKENVNGILWIGTRWSLADPIGRRMELLQTSAAFANRKYKIINLPALNDKDESNFNYDYGVGFSTEYYRARRASFEANNDMASFLAQYQGEPIERCGSLFTPDTMNFYNGNLPEGEPDRVFAFGDLAFGGGDFTSFPIAYQYGERIYIHDVVFNNGDKRITQPLIADAIIRNQVRTADFEFNQGGEAYMNDVAEILNKRNYYCNMNGAYAYSHKRKEFRIFERAPEIREMYFRNSDSRNKEYEQFMQGVFSFVVEGKNKHDDAPDSLSCLAIMKEKISFENIKIIDRMF